MIPNTESTEFSEGQDIVNDIKKDSRCFPGFWLSMDGAALFEVEKVARQAWEAAVR